MEKSAVQHVGGAVKPTITTFQPGESPWPEFGADRPVHCVLPEGCKTDGKVLIHTFIRHAGLGNQMFEWASAYGIAKRLKLPFVWSWTPSPRREFGLTYFGIPEQYLRSVPIVTRLGQGSARIVARIEHMVLNSEERFCGIHCPFQAEECFLDVAEEIRELFAVAPVELDLAPGETPVAVQVRRGDYVGHPSLDVVTLDYFLFAMAWMRRRIENPHFFITSDDMDWCEKHFKSVRNVTLVPETQPIHGLRMLATCEAHIISNSTFGWWGAYLGERGPVVVPEIWHQPTRRYGDWNPVPERWVRGKIKTGGPTFEVIPVREDELLPVPEHKRAIVYPWHCDQAIWHELRFSMRSIDKFFEDKDCPIFIIGTRRPSWLLYEKNRVQFISEWSYRNALIRGVQLAEKVLWMNDDIVMLKPTTWADCERTRYVKEVGPDFLENAQLQSNPWRAGCLYILQLLAAEGVEKQFVYSTHTPYVYRRKEALEILRRFPPFSKYPMELAYFHYHAFEHERLGRLRCNGLPFGSAQFLNYTDMSLSPDLKKALKALLPDYAPWELNAMFQI